MILPSNRVRILVATSPVDFRKGHDGLEALVKNEMRKEPFNGTVFVFRAKRADRLPALHRRRRRGLVRHWFKNNGRANGWTSSLPSSGYSLNLKRRTVVDIVTLACLYTTRIVAGGVATGIPLSVWLLAFAVFFFFALAA